MKILALSDIHGDKHLCKKMAERGALEKVDLVLLAGDLADSEGNVEGIIGPFKDKGLEVAVIPGNHEGMAEINFMTEQYGVKNLHGYSIKKGDIGIFGYGYSNIGIHQFVEKDIFKTLKNAHDHLKDVKKKIMVTHTHPDESLIGLNFFPGSPGIKKAIDELKPDFHLCGHIHESEGIEEKIGNTMVINVGRKGKIIEL